MPSNVVPIESGEMEGLLGIVMTTTGYTLPQATLYYL